MRANFVTAFDLKSPFIHFALLLTKCIASPLALVVRVSQRFVSHFSLPYRRDIDGLRAVAVLSVVLYHFGVPGLAGGFVGVDVFFVISGFLIGGLLWREQEASGRIDLVRFYTRRLRRLAPAFVVMALATAVASWFILLPYEFREFGKQLIAATVYLSNVFFWREAGYFDAASEEKPLLHTWSLSVEEQFYILLPLILIVLFRWAPRLRLGLLWVIALASLEACLFMTPRDSISTFYLLHYRAWEFLAGVLLAIHMALGWRPMAPLAMSAMGLAMILFSLVGTDASAGFPGWQAMIPVFGTLLVLAGGTQDHVLTRWLSRPLPVGIGLISYSLYLWHWPVFVVSHYARDGYAHFGEAMGWMALAFVLAYLSWRCVETPVRTAGWRSGWVFSGAVVTSVVLIGLGGTVFRTDGLPERFSDDVRPHIAASGDFLQDFSRCQIAADGPLSGLEICPIGPDGTPDILVWGDSHLRAFAEGVDAAAWDADRPGLLMWRAGCPPLFGVDKRESYATPAQDAACRAANDQIARALTELDLKDILLIGRWSYYAHGRGVGRDVENTIALSPSFEDAVRPTLDQMAQAGVSVHVLRQVPEIPNYDSRMMARALAHGRVDAEGVRAQTTIQEHQALSRAAAGESPWQNVSHIASWLDPWPDLCAEDTCQALPDGQPFYFDNNHVTNTAARAMSDIFRPVFAP